MEEAYRNGDLGIPAHVEDTGEVNWLVEDALQMEVAIPVIALSVMQLISSRDDRKNWARAIAQMRYEFGGHPFGADEDIAGERREGRVGPFPEKEQLSNEAHRRHMLGDRRRLHSEGKYRPSTAADEPRDRLHSEYGRCRCGNSDHGFLFGP
jgi:hypothetical protein